MSVVVTPIAAGAPGRIQNNNAASASSPVGIAASGAHPVRVSSRVLSQVNRTPQLFLRILQ